MPTCSWFARPILLVSPLGPLYSQQSAAWQDPCPHLVQFVTVDNNVRLEVLDWGGSGRPMVLLAGDAEHAHLSFTQGGGHGGSHPHLVHDFVSSIVEGRASFPEVYQSVNWTCAGIC